MLALLAVACGGTSILLLFPTFFLAEIDFNFFKGKIKNEKQVFSCFPFFLYFVNVLSIVSWGLYFLMFRCIFCYWAYQDGFMRSYCASRSWYWITSGKTVFSSSGANAYSSLKKAMATEALGCVPARSEAFW